MLLQKFSALRIVILVFAVIFSFGFSPISAQQLSVPIEKLRPTEKITPEEITENDAKRTPLGVIERGDGTYSIIEGNRTFAALKARGAKNLPVIVHPLPYQPNVKNIKDLYALNEAAEGEFKALLKNLQEELGGEIKARPHIKNKKRVREKAKIELGGDYSQVTDLWAASLVFDSVDDLLAASDEITKRDDVIWINDRWNNPLPNGYCDFQFSLILSNGAICELQLHHAPIFEVNVGVDHKIYEFVRSNFKKAKMQDCIQRARACQKILYAMATDGRYAALDASTKKDLLQLTTELSTQKSPKKAAAVLDNLEEFLHEISAEKLSNAA